MMTAQQQLEHLDRQQRRLQRRLDLLAEEQRHGLTSPLIQAEGEATLVAMRALLPVLNAVRQAAYDEQRQMRRVRQEA